MRFIGSTIAIAALGAAGVMAQSGTTTKEKTKIEVKDGKTVTVAGCLERNPDGGYMLTSREGRSPYVLVGHDDLSKHVGHEVEVKGKATDRGDGKVQIESKVGTSGGDKTEAKTTVKGDLGARYLGVKSIKMIAASCT